jgi:hypothetical protein
MKYLLVLSLGIGLGIGGEFLIPKKLWTTVGNGCIKERANSSGPDYVFMPELRIYNYKTDEYPVMFGGKAMTFVPSYRYAYALLTGELSYLNQDECNSLKMKFIKAEKK